MIPFRATVVLLAVVLANGCAGETSPQPVPTQVRTALRAVQGAPASAGDRVYEGRVHSLIAPNAELFRYERRVRAAGNRWASSHLTYDSRGDVIVIQSARHTPRYELEHAELIHGQSGVSGSVDVRNGTVSFILTENDKVSTAREETSVPVVAGATMFGYILAHWEELQTGATLPIRFAVIERKETIGFNLEKTVAPEGRTIIKMTPSSMLVRLAIDPTYFEFDTQTRKIIEYTGRVPPFEVVGNRLQPLDARVAYQFVAATFR